MRETEQHRLILHNHYGDFKELWIEPWGDCIHLLPSTTYFVVGDGPVHGTLELELQTDAFTIYGWSGSTLTIFNEQEEILWHSPVPVP